MAPENWWLEDQFPFGDGLFSGAMFVSFRECIWLSQQSPLQAGFPVSWCFMFILGGVVFLVHLIATKQPTDNSGVAGGFRSGGSFKNIIIKWLWIIPKSGMGGVYYHQYVLKKPYIKVGYLLMWLDTWGVVFFRFPYVAFASLHVFSAKETGLWRNVSLSKMQRAEGAENARFASCTGSHVPYNAKDLGELFMLFRIGFKRFHVRMQFVDFRRTFPKVGLMSDLQIRWFSQIRVEIQAESFLQPKVRRRQLATFASPKFALQTKNVIGGAVDGWSPAPVDRYYIPFFIWVSMGFIHPRWLAGFHPSTTGDDFGTSWPLEARSLQSRQPVPWSGN